MVHGLDEGSAGKGRGPHHLAVAAGGHHQLVVEGVDAALPNPVRVPPSELPDRLRWRLGLEAPELPGVPDPELAVVACGHQLRNRGASSKQSRVRGQGHKLRQKQQQRKQEQGIEGRSTSSTRRKVSSEEGGQPIGFLSLPEEEEEQSGRRRRRKRKRGGMTGRREEEEEEGDW